MIFFLNQLDEICYRTLSKSFVRYDERAKCFINVHPNGLNRIKLLNLFLFFAYIYFFARFSLDRTCTSLAFSARDVLSCGNAHFTDNCVDCGDEAYLKSIT